MRTLLIGCMVILGTLAQANALEILSYKDSTSNAVILDDSSVEKVWSSNSPVCLKDGASLIGVNRAFKDLKLGYRDCSNGVGTVRKHKALGYNVTVIKLGELSDKMIQSVLKK